MEQESEREMEKKEQEGKERRGEEGKGGHFGRRKK